VIRFPDIGGPTLEKIVKYLHYKDKYSNSTARIPEFQIDPDEVRAAFSVASARVFFFSTCSNLHFFVYR
jgi:hypothetical protein